MKRLLLILLSGAVAGGFLTAAMVPAQGQRDPFDELEVAKPRPAAQRPVPPKASRNPAAEIEARRNAARRRQIVNLANQLRPIYRFELMSIRTAFHLTKEQFRSIRPETDAAFDEAILKLFEAQQNPPPGPVRVRSADLDYNKVIREAVGSVARRHVPAEQWAAFREDLGRREAGRKQAGVEFLVATLDRELLLKGPQRDQLTESLSAHWDDRWYSALELTLGGTLSFPAIPAELVTPYLSETQRGIWSRMYQYEGPLWGVVFEHGGDAAMDHALGAEPKPEILGKVRRKGFSIEAPKKALSVEPRAKE